MAIARRVRWRHAASWLPTASPSTRSPIPTRRTASISPSTPTRSRSSWPAVFPALWSSSARSPPPRRRSLRPRSSRPISSRASAVARCSWTPASTRTSTTDSASATCGRCSTTSCRSRSRPSSAVAA
uniref:Uncharacterized protein n=1 Tax=Zea mays TaxID=4577 RepID=C4J3W3_MAIZE|nr:unknown [Zea mays]|eukprot:NP_001183149.1 uncharacterized LOC100501519 [Zea mays]